MISKGQLTYLKAVVTQTTAFFICLVLFSSFQKPDPKKATIRDYQIKKNFSFRNAALRIKYSLKGKSERTEDSIDFNSRFELVFEDNFDSLDKRKWRLGQAWGEFHPDYLHQYYSSEMITTRGGFLHLRGEYQPKTFKLADSSVSIPMAVGLINSDISFKQKYGYFEIRSKNPSGAATWPAFWLTGATRWPPEIDIFEMYGRNGKGSIHYQYATIHYGETNTRSRGFLTRKINLPNNTDSVFHTYACEWTPEFIRFYTDGRAVAHISMNSRLREWMNEEMVVIINNSFENSFIKDFRDKKQLNNDFVIDYVRVYKHRQSF